MKAAHRCGLDAVIARASSAPCVGAQRGEGVVLPLAGVVALGLVLDHLYRHLGNRGQRDPDSAGPERVLNDALGLRDAQQLPAGTRQILELDRGLDRHTANPEEAEQLVASGQLRHGPPRPGSVRGNCYQQS